MIVFAHDHRFVKSENNVYSTGGLPASVWERYKKVFGSVSVVGRVCSQVDQDLSVLSLSDSKDVAFYLLDSISNPGSMIRKPKLVVEEVTKVVSASDGVIARLPSEYGFFAIQIAKKLGKPWAVEIVECPWDALWNYGSLKGRLFAPVQFFRLRRATNSATHALYVTEQFLQKRYPCAGKTVSCSNVELESTSNDVLARRLRLITKGNLNFRIGLIGSLVGNAKGIDLAIAAIGILRSKGFKVSLHILGKGDVEHWKNQIPAAAQKYIHFEGVLPGGGAVAQWLDGMDVYVQPSRKEGLPRALIEAMSRALPCVGSNVAGIPELLSEAFIFKAGSQDDFVKCLERLLQNIAMMQKSSLENFNSASAYTSDKLDRKRTEFWFNFRNSWQN